MKTKFTWTVRTIIAGGALLLAGTITDAATLHFNGTSIAPYDDYVTVGSRTNLDLTGTNLTLEAWIKPTGPGSDGTGGGVILGREGEYMLARYANGNLHYAFATAGHAFAFEDTGYPAPTNQWTHVALTYDGARFRFYVNGEIWSPYIASGPIGDLYPAEEDFRIGSRQHLTAGQPQYFRGQIDDVRVWNVTRSATEISGNMNRPLRGDEPGLLAYYRFEEGFGSTTADATGRGLTGTLVNGPAWDSASDALQVQVPITQPATLLTETSARLNASVSTNGILATNSFWLSAHASTALSFDGINDAVAFSLGPNNNYNAYPLTVTAWIKTDRPGGSGGIVNKYTSGSSSGWQLHLANGQVRAWYFRNANTNVFGGGDGLNGGNVDDGQWHHAAFTVGPTGGKLYVDGLLTAATNWVGTPAATTNTQPLRLGAYGNIYFAGQLDEVTLWNAELSAGAISGLMTAPPTPAHPQYANLVAHWPLDEGSGAFVNDARGHNSAGLLEGEPRWVPQARPDLYTATPLVPIRGTNSALDLDGVDDHVRVPAGRWFSNEFTIETWVFARSHNKDARVIDFGLGQASANVLLALSSGTTGRPYFQAYPNGVTAPDLLPLNQWVHLAATLISNTATLYVNGVAVVSGAVAAPNATVTRNSNYIGRSNWGAADNYANALYDDLRIWKVARTPAQIREFMTAPAAPDDPNLVLNYRFDEPSGLAVVDYRTTLPQNGTLTNGASRLAFERTSVGVSGLGLAKKHYFSSVATSTNGTAYGPIESFATPTPVAGTALSFDGTNDFVRIAGFGATMPTTNVTVEFWQRVSSLKSQSTFSLEPDNSSSRFQAHVPNSDGVVYWDFGNITAGAGRLQYTPPVSLVGTWQHFAFVASVPGNYMRIYRNGVLEVSKTGASTFTRGTYDLLLGKHLAGWVFGGDLDEFRVWNTARDGTNILRDFNRRLLGNESGLLAYYRMDEGAGHVLLDATGRGKDGLLVSSPTRVPSTAPVGWPLVTMSDVTGIVLGDVVIEGAIKGDTTSDTRMWVEQGQYVPVPGTAENYFHGYPSSSAVSSIAQINFDAPPIHQSTFSTIAFTSSGAPPEWPGGPGDYYAVRYVGRLFLPATGDYTFYTASDDGSQLFVDGQLVVTNDGVRAAVERGAVAHLTAGYHWLDVRMFESFNIATLVVSYAGPGIPKQVIPATAFLRHELVFTAATLPVTNAAAAGPQAFSALATNLDNTGNYVLRLAVANGTGTNYGTAQTALMGSAGAFTALYLNGIGACVEVPNGTNLLAFPGTDEFTIEAWVNPSILGSTQTVVSKFNQPAQREYFLALNPAGQLVFHRQGSDFVSSAAVSIGQYTHLAATYDGTHRRIYINGQLDPAADAGSGAGTNRGAPFVIGARYWSNSLANFFQGTIDDVRVWQVARSQTQIQADLNRRLSGYELGLLAYYRFDEAQGGFAADSTVYENLGVLRNAPVYVPGGTQFACTSAPPVLNIELLDFAPGVILWWPITCNEYLLEEAETSDAPPDGWYPVREPVTPVGDTYLMVVLWDRYEDGFFRLRRR